MGLWPDSTLSRNLRLRRWFLVGLVLLPLILTFPAIRAYYQAQAWWDFRPQTWDEIGGYVTADYEYWEAEFYRPLARILPALEYKLFGTNPVIPRAVFFAAYAATCLLVFLILEALSGSFLTAAAAALIFAVMPSHVQPVFMMSPNITAVWMCLALLTFWLLGPGYHRKPSWSKVAIAFASYLGGVLSYPHVLLIPVFLLAYELLWGAKRGWSSVKRTMLRIHLPLWLITGMILALRCCILSRLSGEADWYLNEIKTLTITKAAGTMICLFYGGIFPLRLSPALVICGLLLFYFGFRSNWRFSLFLLIWIVIAPALSYAHDAVLWHRLYLFTFGAAALISYVLVFCLGGFLDTKQHSERLSRILFVLDWTAAISIGYWVFELLRMGWADMFHGESLSVHLRFVAAPIAAIAIILRSIVSKNLTPRFSRRPLRFISAGLVVMIIGAYVAGFVNLLGMNVARSDEMEMIPRAIVKVQPQVPDNTLIFIVIGDELLSKLGDSLGQLDDCLRSEYGKNVSSYIFSDWVKMAQYQKIPQHTTVLAFRFDGERAVRDQELAARILARQRSYLGLSSDVIHAQVLALAAVAGDVRLTPYVDSMLIDKAQLYTEVPMEHVIARFEFAADGLPVALELPARAEGTKVTVALDHQHRWQLAGLLDWVSISAASQGKTVAIRKARLLQTRGLISEALPQDKPPGATTVLLGSSTHRPFEKVTTFFWADETERCIAIP